MRYETTIHHRFEVGGEPFVYVAPTAAVVGLDHSSDALLSEFSIPGGVDLAAFEDRHRGDGGEARETFEDMVALGLLRPLGEAPPPATELPPMPYPMSTLVLNVTNRCNLSCTYCYEYGEDRIAGDDDGRAAKMSGETARESVDFLFDNAGARREVTITFFGGETLINFETIREAVAHAEERAVETGRRVSFALTTNATLLTDEISDFLVAHRFGVNVSIDGAESDHDRHRTFASGRGSYEEIVPRIRRLLERNHAARGRPIGARVTLTRGSSEIREIYRHLTEDIGFQSVGFAPVTSAPDRDYALDEGNMGGVLDEFAALAKDYAELAETGRLHGFSNIHDLVSEIHQGINKAHPCGAGLGLLGVSTEGELGLCHRFVESGEHEVGDVRTGIDHEKREAFLQSTHVSQKIACHDCFARPHCSGGCYHEAYVRYGDATQPNLHYCEWIRSWTALGLETYAHIAQTNPGFLERFAAEPAPAKPDNRSPNGTP